MEYSWNDSDLVNAFNIAIKLGTRSPTASVNPDKIPAQGHSTLEQLVADAEGEGAGDYDQYTESVPIGDPYQNLENVQVYHTVYNTENADNLEFEDVPVPSSGKRKNNKKKQVRFNQSVAEDGYAAASTSGWDKEHEQYYQHEGQPGPEYDGSRAIPSVAPEWLKAFPNLTAPPMPESVGQKFKKGDISSLLTSWYMCGYHSGYYDAKQDALQQDKGN